MKVESRVILDKHQAICSDAEFRMTDLGDLLIRESQLSLAIIDNHEVVACCLIFMEVNGSHFKKLKIGILKRAIT